MPFVSCEFCQFKYPSEDALKRHLEIDVSCKTLKIIALQYNSAPVIPDCEKCGKKFKSRQSHTYHTTKSKSCGTEESAVPTNESIPPCSVCGKEFSSLRGRDYHIKNSVCKNRERRKLIEAQLAEVKRKGALRRIAAKAKAAQAKKARAEKEAARAKAAKAAKEAKARAKKNVKLEKARAEKKIKLEKAQAEKEANEAAKRCAQKKRKATTPIEIKPETVPQSFQKYLEQTQASRPSEQARESVYTGKRWAAKVTEEHYCNAKSIKLFSTAIDQSATVGVKINAKRIDKGTLGYGKAMSTSDGGSDHFDVMNCGGKVQSLAWCPCGNDRNPSKDAPRYVAVSILPNDTTLVFNSVFKSNFSSFVQIWKCHPPQGGAPGGTCMELLFVLTHEFGAAWSMSWCPPCEPVESRMGLLAIAHGDGTVRIHSVPSDKHMHSAGQKYKSADWAASLAPLIDSPPACTINFDEVIKSLQWNPNDPRQILVGGSSGVVKLLEYRQQEEHFVPVGFYNSAFSFVASGVGIWEGVRINALAWCPVDKNFFVEGSSNGGKIRIWDAREDKNLPLYEIRFQGQSGVFASVNSVAWVSRTILAVGFCDGRFSVVDLEKEMQKESPAPRIFLANTDMTQQSSSEVTSVLGTVIGDTCVLWYASANGQTFQSRCPNRFVHNGKKNTFVESAMIMECGSSRTNGCTFRVPTSLVWGQTTDARSHGRENTLDQYSVTAMGVSKGSGGMCILMIGTDSGLAVLTRRDAPSLQL
jgi:WD40 repeat protein